MMKKSFIIVLSLFALLFTQCTGTIGDKQEADQKNINDQIVSKVQTTLVAKNGTESEE